MKRSDVIEMIAKEISYDSHYPEEKCPNCGHILREGDLYYDKPNILAGFLLSKIAGFYGSTFEAMREIIKEGISDIYASGYQREDAARILDWFCGQVPVNFEETTDVP